MVWTTSYYHCDALGSTRLLSDTGRNPRASYPQTAFGEQLAHTSTVVNPFRFIGQLGYYFDSDSKTFSVRQRMYDPTAARWLSNDPVRSNDNAYCYVNNNPLQFFDPNGLETIPSDNPPSYRSTVAGPPPYAAPSGYEWIGIEAGGSSGPGVWQLRRAQMIPGRLNSTDGSDWRIFWILPSPGERLVRKTGGIGTPSSTEAAKSGITASDPHSNLHPVEHVLNQHQGRGSPFVAASTLPEGAPNIIGEPVWIDVSKLEPGTEVLKYDDIVRQSRDFLSRNEHLRKRFNSWKAAQHAEAEVLIRGSVRATAIRTKAQVRVGTTLRVVGKGLTAFAIAADTYSFWVAENKSREVARIAGGWIGASAFGATGASAGATFAGAAGQIGPQVLTPEEVVTVPVASGIGAIVGGIFGYWAGSQAGRTYYDLVQQEMARLAPMQ